MSNSGWLGVLMDLMDHCVCNRSKWLIVCKNHLEFYAIKILLHLPFSWFALNLGKIGRDDVVKGPNASKKIAFYQFIHMTGKMASHTILCSEFGLAKLGLKRVMALSNSLKNLQKNGYIWSTHHPISYCMDSNYNIIYWYLSTK